MRITCKTKTFGPSASPGSPDFVCNSELWPTFVQLLFTWCILSWTRLVRTENINKATSLSSKSFRPHRGGNTYMPISLIQALCDSAARKAPLNLRCTSIHLCPSGHQMLALFFVGLLVWERPLLLEYAGISLSLHNNDPSTQHRARLLKAYWNEWIKEGMNSCQSPFWFCNCIKLYFSARV